MQIIQTILNVKLYFLAIDKTNDRIFNALISQAVLKHYLIWLDF